MTLKLPAPKKTFRTDTKNNDNAPRFRSKDRSKSFAGLTTKTCSKSPRRCGLTAAPIHQPKPISNVTRTPLSTSKKRTKNDPSSTLKQARPSNRTKKLSTLTALTRQSDTHTSSRQPLQQKIFLRKSSTSMPPRDNKTRCKNKESPQPLRPNEQLQNQHMLHYQPLKQHVRYQDKQIQQKAEQSNPRDNAATWTVIIDDKSLPSNLDSSTEQLKKRMTFMRIRQRKLEKEKANKQAADEKKRKPIWCERPPFIHSTSGEQCGVSIQPNKRNVGGNSTGSLGSLDSVNSDIPMPEYHGTAAYKDPKVKSNRKIIQNAICHCCLCGKINEENKLKCLQAIFQSEATHFIALFREGMKFRSIYEYLPETDTINRIYGIGPKKLIPKMIQTFYKYCSGAKEFIKMETKHISIQVDGIAIKMEAWDSRKTSQVAQGGMKHAPTIET